MSFLTAVQGLMGQVLGYVLNQAAAYLNARGDYDGATTLLRRLVEINETVNTNDPIQIARGLGNLGEVLKERETGLVEAEEIHAEALAIKQAHLPPDDPSIAISLSNMGGILLKRKEFSKAENLYLRAAKIEKVAHGAVSTEYATDLNNLGALYFDWALATGRNDLWQKERDAKEEAANIFRALRGSRHPDVAGTQNNFAVMYANLGDPACAAEHMALAVAIDLSLDLLAHPRAQSHVAGLLTYWIQSGQSDKAARLQAGDGADIVPIVEQVEAEHRAWVAEEPTTRDFGPPSPVTGARA